MGLGLRPRTVLQLYALGFERSVDLRHAFDEDCWLGRLYAI